MSEPQVRCITKREDTLYDDAQALGMTVYGTVRHGKCSLVPVRCGPHAHCLRG